MSDTEKCHACGEIKFTFKGVGDLWWCSPCWESAYRLKPSRPNNEHSRLERYVLALATGVYNQAGIGTMTSTTPQWADGLVDDAKALMAAVDAEEVRGQHEKA